MAIKYISLKVDIHGIQVEDKEDLNLLIKTLRESMKTFLKNHPYEFNFRDQFESDIEVCIDEYAGQGE